MPESSLLLPEGFLLSQHSLSTYQRCKRRFLLKYVHRQPWPVSEGDEPLETQQHLERGVLFHRWIERALQGLPSTVTGSRISDSVLAAWWDAWRAFDLEQLPQGIILVELPLVVALPPFRLYARYDMLALKSGGRSVIMDWKTLQSVPSVRTLSSRLQTRIYSCVLADAGAVLTGGVPIDPESIEMGYWFADAPDNTVFLAYSRIQHDADRAFLTGLAQEIASLPEEAFAKTEQLSLCASCTYRTLCERADGSASGAEWLDEEIDFALDSEATPFVDW